MWSSRSINLLVVGAPSDVVYTNWEYSIYCGLVGSVLAEAAGVDRVVEPEDLDQPRERAAVGVSLPTADRLKQAIPQAIMAWIVVVIHETFVFKMNHPAHSLARRTFCITTDWTAALQGRSARGAGRRDSPGCSQLFRCSRNRLWTDR